MRSDAAADVQARHGIYFDIGAKTPAMTKQLVGYISLNCTSPEDKNALDFVIAQIESISQGYDQDPVNTNFVQNEILIKTTLPDREDARHLAIAWISCCDYFITMDWNTILNLNQSRMIESALSSITGITNTNNSFEVIDSKTFQSQHFPVVS